MNLNLFHTHLDELRETVDRCEALLPALGKAAEAFCACLLNGHKVLACGNGGSACDALHLVEELVGKYSKPRRALPAVCLSADSAILTCIANDWDYATVFERQVQALGQSGDFLVVFSSSGNSENIVRAVRAANAAGVHTLALIGKDGGKLKGMAEHEIIIPGQSTARIQEMQTWFLHELLEALEEALLKSN